MVCSFVSYSSETGVPYRDAYPNAPSYSLEDTSKILKPARRSFSKKEEGKVTNKKALAAFLLAFSGLLLIWVPFLDILLLTLAMIYAIKSLKEFKKEPEKYKGKDMAIGAIVIVSVLTLISLAVMVLLIIFFSSPHGY